jgi:hypothetical protein
MRGLFPLPLALLLGGVFAAPARAGDSTIRLTGKSGITIADKVIGAKSGIDGVVIRNCKNITLRRIKVQGGSRAFFIADSTGITLDACEATDARKQGFLTNNCRDLKFIGCVAKRTAEQHGFYAGGRTQGARFERCEARDCGRAGIQVNSEGASPATEVVIRDCTITGNSKGNHRADVNLLAVGTDERPFLVTDCRIDSRKVGLAAARWQGNSSYGQIVRNTIRGRTKRVDIVASPGVTWDGS